MMRQDATQREGPESTEPRPKATLFCTDCGYSGHPSRDWHRRTGGTIVCPTCGTEVAERSRPHGDRDDGTGIVQAWAGLVVASSMLCPRVVQTWCHGHERTGVGTGPAEDDRG